MSAGSEGKIFVVDDSSTLRALVVQWVRQAGYTPIPCSNGLECLDSLRTLTPDLILMDLEMPGLRGSDCCRHLKSLRESRHVPVVMMTTRHAPADVESWSHAGAEDYLPKPIIKSQFDSKIAALKAPRPTRLERLTTGRLNPAAAILSRVAQELRQSERMSFFRTVEFRAPGKQDWQSGFTQNLSSGGLCIKTLTPLSAGTEIEVKITFQDVERICSGMVAWNEPAASPAMGLCFTQLGWEAGLEVLGLLKAGRTTKGGKREDRPKTEKPRTTPTQLR